MTTPPHALGVEFPTGATQLPPPTPTNKFRTNKAFQFLTESMDKCDTSSLIKDSFIYRESVQGIS